MIDAPRYRFGDMVWHRTSGDDAGIVVGLLYRPGTMLYEVTWAGRATDHHFECELTSERPFFSSVGGKEEV